MVGRIPSFSELSIALCPPSFTHSMHLNAVAIYRGTKGGFLKFSQRDLERVHVHVHTHTHTHTHKSHRDWLVHLFGTSEVFPGDLPPSALTLCLDSFRCLHHGV